MAHVFEIFHYIPGITDIETTLDEILAHRSGVCQNFAYILSQILRIAGIPAHYVRGYICLNKNGLRGEGATHAWVEAWLPGAGWIGVDPTNNVVVTDTHVTLSVGHSFIDCTPVKGTFKGVAVYLSVGYEDGHVFREHNALQINKTSSAQQSVDHAQQQQ
jgi:transglutaminase-like putative cysteine protease